MAPEQARGAVVDRRADIWTFGAVLFELLSGQRLINEATASDALAAVLKSDLNFSALPAATPQPIRRLIERCLTRDPKQRLQAIGEARIILSSPVEEATPVALIQTGPKKTPVFWIVATVVFACLGRPGRKDGSGTEGTGNLRGHETLARRDESRCSTRARHLDL
jgi:serine/threonine protein kinase